MALGAFSSMPLMASQSASRIDRSSLHYVAYGAVAFVLVHGILIDPNLKNGPPDLLDAEKLLVEVCAASIIAASVWRIRYALRRGKRMARPSVQKVDYEPL
jgi:hypothetical protein